MAIVTRCVLVQLSLLALCVLLRNFRSATPPPRVELSCGTLHGTWSSGVAAFRGIRYGEAPLGRRRWRPAAAACSGGMATMDGERCMQGGGLNESEDCLNLNVFVPSKYLDGTARLPVIVWIHGGSNIEGSVEFYGPIESIVQKRDCVLVAMNYRLGIFGYLALRELAEVDPRGSSGNLGITDQQLALHWVQQNILAFGGDPKHVTLLGQSSGGSNIHAHLASPSSRGLFHRAISLSGSPNITMDRKTKEDQDRRLILPETPCAGMFGETLLDCLYTADAHTLDKALPSSYKIFEPLYDYPNTSQGIASRASALLYVDGVTVSAPPEEALRQGINDVPLLLSSTQAEMGCAPALQLANLTQQGLRDFYQQQFAPEYGEDAANMVYDLYGHYQPPEYAAYAVDADTAVACGLRRLARAAGENFRSPVYWGTVTAAPSRDLKGQRFAYHNWDFTAAAEVFTHYDKHYQASQKDLPLGARLRADWFNFILHGEILDWKKVQDSEPGQVIGVVLGENGTQWYPDHKALECGFWNSIGVDQRWWWIN